MGNYCLWWSSNSSGLVFYSTVHLRYLPLLSVGLPKDQSQLHNMFRYQSRCTTLKVCTSCSYPSNPCTGKCPSAAPASPHLNSKTSHHNKAYVLSVLGLVRWRNLARLFDNLIRFYLKLRRNLAYPNAHHLRNLQNEATN